MPWATAALTLTLTGITVTDAHLAQAQAIIELFSGVTEDASDADLVSGRNLRLLSHAVAYESVFVKDRPDLFTAADVSDWSQDGVSARPANENAALLAPFALRCLRRLSWKTEPLRMLTRRGTAPGDRGNRDSAVRDDQFAWIPMRS